MLVYLNDVLGYTIKDVHYMDYPRHEITTVVGVLHIFVVIRLTLSMYIYGL